MKLDLENRDKTKHSFIIFFNIPIWSIPWRTYEANDFIFRFFSFPLFAKVQSYDLTAGRKVSVNVMKDWEVVKDLFRIPLRVLGLWANASRPVVLIVITDIKKSQLSEAELKKSSLTF